MNSIFSKNLKLLRESLDLKQDALAKKLDISRSLLSYYENGKGEPTMSVLKKMSSFFNISIDKLVNENLMLSDAFINQKINSILYSDSINFSSKYNDYTSILIELENKKSYYLKLINKDIPKKINEIDDLINYLKMYNPHLKNELTNEYYNDDFSMYQSKVSEDTRSYNPKLKIKKENI